MLNLFLFLIFLFNLTFCLPINDHDDQVHLSSMANPFYKGTESRNKAKDNFLHFPNIPSPTNSIPNINIASPATYLPNINIPSLSNSKNDNDKSLPVFLDNTPQQSTTNNNPPSNTNNPPSNTNNPSPLPYFYYDARNMPEWLTPPWIKRERTGPILTPENMNDNKWVPPEPILPL